MGKTEGDFSIRAVGTIGPAIVQVVGQRTTAREVHVAAAVQQHYRDHSRQLNIDRAEAILTDVLASPRAIYAGNKANSLILTEDWDEAHILAVVVKVLTSEMWLETLYVTGTERFERRVWAKVGPLYQRETRG